MKIGILFLYISFQLNLRDVAGLKNVTLAIEPRIVEYQGTSILKCTYDLESNPLYSVKWYRGEHEFYRYTPSESPPTKIFPFKGMRVDVDASNSTQVVLKNIDFNLSGRFRCEVTTDLPHLYVEDDTQSMMVIQLPESSPKISVGHDAFDYGDVLRANCSSPPSRPPVVLQFMLNNFTVAQSNLSSLRKERSWSDLSMELHLRDMHFDRGRLILRCIALLPDIYHDEVELELDSARNPVPERVQGYSGGERTTKHAVLLYILLIYWNLLKSSTFTEIL